ncbi:MAG: hypothetical protein JSV21_04565 [Nitrospirota bacterium]|nr:MAG: hypothetical protein JSV21_04565 [Nitrospirota bacterium]
MKAKEKIRKISDSLKEAGVADADREAETIVMRISGIGRELLYIDDPDLEANVSEGVDNALARRALGEPLQYILGSLEFYGLTINVGKGVLIPRPETELMVDEVIKYVRSTKKAHAKVLILDLCTGSGCIALALAANIR